jgi:metal-dependent amidase/aminoacylase/carboxypeptidase family protein
MNVIESLLADAAAITALRREIHAHPELCFQEQRTSDLVAAKLTEWGIPIRRGLAKTAVVGIVEGRRGRAGGAIGII